MELQDRLHASLTGDSRYRLLVEAVTDYAIYMLDPAGFITSWNAGAQRFKGYQASEIIGQHFSRFYTDEDRQHGLPERALKVAARDGTFEAKGWRIRKDGTRFWAHVVIDPIRQDSGEIVGYAKITRDLTEQVAAEDALRRSEEQFKLLVQSVTDYAIYMLDANGIVSNWNAGAERIKGYRPDEIIGKHFSLFYTEEDRRSGLPNIALRSAVANGRFEREGWRIRKDGTRFWANVVIDPIRDGEGGVIGFAKITRDITERRDAQRELEQAREALFQSQKMDALGQLTGGIAHDFNNLLMAILGSLELVRKRLPADPRIAPLIENAIQGVNRGTALTQRMLAFARRQELNTESLDVPAIVVGITELLQRSLGPQVPIETRFAASLGRILADANQLEMALINLAVNARDAMPDGGPIVIAARQEEIGALHEVKLPPGQYICLSVTDRGEGMDQATLSRAMEPFFTTKGIGKGTGLGLSMVHGLTEQSGGRFVLKSSKGEGTTAEIWLPVAKATPVVQLQGRLAADAPSPRREPEALAIVAVDDDSLVLMNTAIMLEDLGHTVFAVTSAREALDILDRESNIDLIITDQAMPRMSGAQLIEAIRSERSSIPIILATGYAELPEGTDLDIVKLAKPFSQDDLARAVGEAVGVMESGERLRRLSAY